MPPERASSSVKLSVIVPAHRCAQTLAPAIVALRASDMPAAQWELIVVDDASGDDTTHIAETQADRALVLTGAPHGPAFARNRGAEIARGKVLLFVDADVLVHPDVLRRMTDLFDADMTIGAAFGAYDTQPEASGMVSRYRNLMHHYVHSRNAGDAETFWAGCGAVRRTLFAQVGGFDEQRYPRPQIEDIELGHRLRDTGVRIVLEPTIQCTHLKRWNLRGMIRSDVHDRGVPWVELLLHDGGGGARASTLNVQRSEKLFTVMVGLSIVTLAGGVATRDLRWALLAALLLLVVIIGNVPVLHWLGRTTGWAMALVAVPLRLLYYLLCGIAVALGLFRYVRHQQNRRSMQNARRAVTEEERIEQAIALAFAPMDKLAFGVAVGCATGSLIFLATVGRLLRLPEGTTALSLLSQFFAGYAETWPGAFIGFAWGLATGCIAGWFAAFLRNVIMATWLLIVRVRADLAASRDFLDHI